MMSSSSTIYSDAIAVEGVKMPSRKKYLKVWCEFKERAVNSGEFEERMPTEDEFAEYSGSSGWKRSFLPLHCGRPIVLSML